MGPSCHTLLTLSLAAALATPALAQTTVLTMTIPAVGRLDHGIAASVISADATATEFVLACVNVNGSSPCPIPASNKFRQRPKTAEFATWETQDNGGQKTTKAIIVGCALEKTPLTCSQANVQVVGSSTVSSTAVRVTPTADQTDAWVKAVTVTAGLEKLKATPAGAPPAQTTTAMGAAPKMTGGLVTAAMMAVAGGVMFV